MALLQPFQETAQAVVAEELVIVAVAAADMRWLDRMGETMATPGDPVAKADHPTAFELYCRFLEVRVVEAPELMGQPAEEEVVVVAAQS
jgi:hypothetical protein